MSHITRSELKNSHHTTQQSLCCDASSSSMSTASSFNVDHFLFILFGLLHLVRLHKLRYLLPLVLRRLSIIEPLEPFDGLFLVAILVLGIIIKIERISSRRLLRGHCLGARLESGCRLNVLLIIIAVDII